MGEQPQQIEQIVIAVHPGNGFPHGVNAGGEGKEGVDGLEKVRCDLDGKGAAGPRYLDDQKNDSDGFAHVSEGNGQSIDKQSEHHAGADAG